MLFYTTYFPPLPPPPPPPPLFSIFSSSREIEIMEKDRKTYIPFHTATIVFNKEDPKSMSCFLMLFSLKKFFFCFCDFQVKTKFPYFVIYLLNLTIAFYSRNKLFLSLPFVQKINIYPLWNNMLMCISISSGLLSLFYIRFTQ